MVNNLRKIFKCGEKGIRTLGTREGTTVFETAPIDHSGISPKRNANVLNFLRLF